jgi:hypothetical protein
MCRARIEGCGDVALAFEIENGMVSAVRLEGDYFEKGDAESLSAWFADNLEISIFSRTTDTSRNQAKQIMKSFFKSYTPRSFEISHKAGRPNMKYALGVLTAGGEIFQVTIFVGIKDSEYKIQQMKIERID